MRHLLFFFSFLSPPILFGATLMLAIGFKGDPMNMTLAFYGVVMMLLGALAFPRQGHPIYRAIERMTAPSKQEPEDMLKQMVDFNMAAVDFEPNAQPFHAGWSRLDLILVAPENPSSWIGGLPEMPPGVDWPQTDGNAALFLAQIALSDLPDDIWGGLGPKSGWLLFFLAPRDWGGLRVLHVKQRGAPRPYPNGACIENYLDHDDLAAMKEIGRAAGDFRPPRIALAVSPTNTQPADSYLHIDELRALRERHRSIDLSDPLFAPFAIGANPTRLSVEMLARQTYFQNPDDVSPEIREIFEPTWTFQASLEAATMSGPVREEFFYTAPEDPVLLLQLHSSKLLGWTFGGNESLGIFIAPKDLRRRRWHKAWFDYTG